MFYADAVSIVATQIMGAPLYWINRNWYYAYMAVTKQTYGVVITTMTYVWSPITVRASGDASVGNQMRKSADGRLVCNFPDRIVMIANHQVGLTV